MTIYICADCGIEVTDVVRPSHLPTPSLCMECRVIREADPEDRHALRRVFRKEGPPTQSEQNQ